MLIHYYQGRSGPDIADMLNIGKDQVYYWINRYEKEGLAGLEDRNRPGRPRKVDYIKLRNALEKPATEFGYDTDQWDVDLIHDYLTNIQKVDISKHYVYEILNRIDIDLSTHEQRMQEQQHFPDLRTKSGRMISSFHLEVMHDVELLLDAPIHKIITENGIKPVLKVKYSDKYSTILQGETQQGRLTIRYEEFSE